MNEIPKSEKPKKYDNFNHITGPGGSIVFWLKLLQSYNCFENDRNYVINKIRIVVPAPYNFVNGRQPIVVVSQLLSNDKFIYSDETVTTSVLNKEGLPRNVCQNSTLAVWANVQNRWERSARLEHWQSSKTCQAFLTFQSIYICRYFADKQLLFLTVNTLIH